MDIDQETAGVTRFPLARRAFAMTSLISGFTLATTRVEAQAIQTDTTGLQVGETSIPVSGGSLPAYFAHPATGSRFPTVLVIQEIFGVHEYIKDLCRRFAKAGYLAVATEFYARQADLSKIADAQQIFREVILQAPDAVLMADLDATAAWAAADKGDPEKLAVTGFCRGGRNVWLYAAHNPRLKAAVAWYGPLGGSVSPVQPRTALDVAGEIKCPLLAIYGGADTGIPAAQREQAEAKARAAGKTVEFVVYPDAPHGFHADYRPTYREASAKEGWAKMLAWLRQYGVS